MILFDYIHDRRRVAVGFLLLWLAAGSILWLFGLTFSEIAYCCLVTAVVGAGLFGVPDYIRYARRIAALKTLRQMAPELPEPLVPSKETPLAEQLLTETLESLRLHKTEREQNQLDRQEEMLEYYTLWVHQVKTPLAAMRLILQSKPEDSEALGQELFKTERYIELVLGYLRIYSMNADLQLNLRSVRPLAAQAVKKFATQFIYKGLRLELAEFDNQVITDEKWLVFVLEQLISNAIKYTSRNGWIAIRMDSQDILSIKDSGVGIDPGDLPRIFERGFTGRNGRVEGSSTGLGLYLTKQVLDKLGNTIQVLSTPGAGTEVRVNLHRESD